MRLMYVDLHKLQDASCKRYEDVLNIFNVSFYDSRIYSSTST